MKKCNLDNNLEFLTDLRSVRQGRFFDGRPLTSDAAFIMQAYTQRLIRPLVPGWTPSLPNIQRSGLVTRLLSGVFKFTLAGDRLYHNIWFVDPCAYILRLSMNY